MSAGRKRGRRAAPRRQQHVTHFQLRAPTPLVRALDDLAARSGRSRNAEIVAALEAHARAQGAGTGLEAGLVETHAAYCAHRDRLRAALTELELDVAEASLICDALNGARLDDKQAKAFVRRLAAMTPLQAMAVADAAERFWAASGAADTESVLRAVGLVQRER